jgi:integrase
MRSSVSLTKRLRRRRQQNGEIVEQLRYVLNYADPKTGQRKQRFFERLRDAQLRQAELTTALHEGSYFDERHAPTIDVAADHYLAERQGKVKPSTLIGYRVVVQLIKGPLLHGTQRDRALFKITGQIPSGIRHSRALGYIKISDLTTAEIRIWHGKVAETSGDYSANRAASHLRAILALAEEDFGVRAPSMPHNLARRRMRARKLILASSDVGTLLEFAGQDLERGIYYAFPFLAGTRPSEQLALLWEDIDFDRNLLLIRRMQEMDGSTTNITKTDAGQREVPMAPLLRDMLLSWRLRCPRLKGQLVRVFPGLGRLQTWPLPRKGGGGPLNYRNFLRRFWKPVFKKLGLPYVTPHSARHCFISVMQAQGIEVGLVAKLAGHANPTVTLGHYTQAVRGGEEAVKALQGAYIANLVAPTLRGASERRDE